MQRRQRMMVVAFVAAAFAAPAAWADAAGEKLAKDKGCTVISRGSGTLIVAT